jgi:hypothetical protein
VNKPQKEAFILAESFASLQQKRHQRSSSLLKEKITFCL